MYKKRKPQDKPQEELTENNSSAGNGNQTQTGSQAGNSQEPVHEGDSTVTEKAEACASGAEENEAAAGTEQAAETNALNDRLSKAEDDLKTLSDRYLRLMAEYENYRKRSQKEREALYLDSVATVVKEWLPVIDNLARAEKAALAVEGESAASIAEGITLVLRQANEAMERLNVREIDCLGEPFDPKIADAVLHVDDDSVGPSTVVEVLQKGYACGERVIRHCVVKVAN